MTPDRQASRRGRGRKQQLHFWKQISVGTEQLLEAQVLAVWGTGTPKHTQSQQEAGPEGCHCECYCPVSDSGRVRPYRACVTGRHRCRKGPSRGGRSTPESEQTAASPRGVVTEASAEVPSSLSPGLRDHHCTFVPWSRYRWWKPLGFSP